MTDKKIEKPLHVVQLTASNVMRLKAVRIRPGEGPLVIIGGKNAQGKTSCISAIAMALGGAKEIPLEPVRHGARKAEIIVDLGEIVVLRSFTAKGTELVVKAKDGKIFPSPQKMLDELCARISFDPLEFSRLEPKKQDALLRKLAGLDTTDLDADRASIYEARADVNRDVARLSATFDAMPDHADAPVKPIDVAGLTDEMQKINAHNSDRRLAMQRYDREEQLIGEMKREIERSEAKVLELKELIVKMRGDANAKIMAAEELAIAIGDELPIDGVQEKLRTAEATNAKMRANAAKVDVGTKLQAKTDQARDMTAAIESIDEKKAERLAACRFPVPGLGFDDSGPLLNGVPLAQASAAEKLRVSVAIGAALNPRIKIALVRDGSLLDDDSMTLLAKLAAENDMQCWVERVSDKDEGAIILSDGEVLGAESDEKDADATAQDRQGAVPS